MTTDIEDRVYPKSQLDQHHLLASLRWYASNFLNLRNDDSTQVVSLLHKFRMSKNFKADVLSFDIFEKSSILEILNYSKIFHLKTSLWLFICSTSVIMLMYLQGRQQLSKTGGASNNAARRRCPAAPSILPKYGGAIANPAPPFIDAPEHNCLLS